MTRMVAVSRLPATEQPAEERKLGAEIMALPRQAVLARVLLRVNDRTGEVCRRTHAQVRALMALVAAERYRMKNKAWPDKLEQLKPTFLAEVPLDPFDGKPMRYRKLADGVVAYSVGQDGKDGGGNVDRSLFPSPDEGYRLWDVKARRQPPGGKP
jgi:hypothetical protein